MTAHSTEDQFLRSAPLEIASGWSYGLLPSSPLPEVSRSPRQALDDAIRPHLINGPCYVTFSGGRDSAAVLAAATQLARREGHELPIPLTRVYPDLPDTDESSWQRMVIDHLRLGQWIRVKLSADDTDLLGPFARAAVRRHGLVWPPAVQVYDATLRQLTSGAVLTGEGGDAVLGARRGAAFAILRRRQLTGQLTKQAVAALLPRRLRRTVSTAALHNASQARWLRPGALAEHARRIARDETAEPLRYDLGTWHLTRFRYFAVASHNQAAIAAESGLSHSDPLLDPGFIAALARSGRRLGFGSRTATMATLFSDVLPAAVIARRTKAFFNHAYAGSATREFASNWDGGGVDAELVDSDRLRAVWLSDEPTMATGMLLHSAWLAQGAPEL